MTRLDEIEARANAATEGPWGVSVDQYAPIVLGPPADDDRLMVTGDVLTDNAEFIAHARQDVPALVAAVRAVLSQHAPDGRGNCGPCDDAHGEDGWPCSTVREIHRLLEEDA